MLRIVGKSTSQHLFQNGQLNLSQSGATFLNFLNGQLNLSQSGATFLNFLNRFSYLQQDSFHNDNFVLTGLLHQLPLKFKINFGK